MAYTLSNKCTKKFCKRTVLVQLIIEHMVTCFFGTQCIWAIYSAFAKACCGSVVECWLECERCLDRCSVIPQFIYIYIYIYIYIFLSEFLQFSFLL